MKILLLTLMSFATINAEQGWYPHEGGLMKYRVNIRFGEEPTAFYLFGAGHN